ncbi:peptidase family m48 domain-containing protein [Ditylenchus destructor]|nr:peptidase family m48 domain-containing protein [Ditylenchus destructor]
MDDESAIPLTQLGDETNRKQCLEMPICIDKREAEGESEDRTPKPNCLIRCGNFVRAKSKLFWLLFFIKTICFVVELGIYSKQSDFILSTNYSAAMTKFNGSLEAFEDAKQEHLSQHQSEMFGLILLDLVILVFIFVEAGPYLWSLIGRLLERIIGFCRRAMLFVRWEMRSDSSEAHEIQHSMFATFLVLFVREAIGGVIALDVLSILSSFVTAIAWSVVVGIGLLIIKLPKYVSWLMLWIFTAAVIYISTDVYFYLTEVRKNFPDDDLQKELLNFSVKVGFNPEHVYITKNTEHGMANDIPVYYADVFFHKRIVFRDTAIGYLYDEIGMEDAFQAVKDFVRAVKLLNNRKVLAVFAHEIGHWTYNHVAWMRCVHEADRLLLVLLFVALHKYESLYNAFGFKSQPKLVGAIIILYMVAAPFNLFTTFVINRMNQLTEFQADHYTITVGLGPEFCLFLKKWSDRIPFQEDWLFSLYQSTHPPHYERVKALNCTGA